MAALPVRFVLLRPRNPENLGAAARALKNFGFSDWTWVDAWMPAEHPRAQQLAVHAEELLAGARRVPTLAEAVADCVWVVGTSSRSAAGKRRIAPRALAQTLRERAADGPVALVFGDERSGMTAAEIDACHALSTVPVEDAQPSINLAQAVLLYAYELHLASHEPAPEGPRAAAATESHHTALRGALEEVLRQGRFLHADGRGAVRALAAPWVRSGLSLREARLWMAALKRLARRE